MTDRYRVFVGLWDDGDPEWTHVDVRGLTWGRAVTKLATSLEAFKDDTCETCRDDAAAELGRLISTAPGRFEASVDGEDYLIVPDGEDQKR